MHGKQGKLMCESVVSSVYSHIQQKQSNTGITSFMLPVKFKPKCSSVLSQVWPPHKWCLPWCLQEMRVQARGVIPFSKCLYRQIFSSVSGVLCQRQCFCEKSPLAFNFHIKCNTFCPSARDKSPGAVSRATAR